MITRVLWSNLVNLVCLILIQKKQVLKHGRVFVILFRFELLLLMKPIFIRNRVWFTATLHNDFIRCRVILLLSQCNAGRSLKLILIQMYFMTTHQWFEGNINFKVIIILLIAVTASPILLTRSCSCWYKSVRWIVVWTDDLLENFLLLLWKQMLLLTIVL